MLKMEEFQLSMPRNLDCDLDRATRHTVAHLSLTYTYLHTIFHSNRINFLWTARRPALLGSEST